MLNLASRIVMQLWFWKAARGDLVSPLNQTWCIHRGGLVFLFVSAQTPEHLHMSKLYILWLRNRSDAPCSYSFLKRAEHSTGASHAFRRSVPNVCQSFCFVIIQSDDLDAGSCVMMPTKFPVAWKQKWEGGETSADGPWISWIWLYQL